VKKPGLILLIGQLQIRSEQPTDEEMKKILMVELLDLLLTYINDPDIREAADEVCF
jgi:hypothetical protein